MNKKKRTRVIVLYIIMCVLTLASCADRQAGAVLDQAEQMLDDAQYEEAYALLDSIDGGKYAQGSSLQSRYALLYTRALYKNYIVSPSDSLISIAVDYAEEHGNDEDKFYAYLYQGIVRYELNDYSNSSVSLIRALANVDDIEDAYSKGQLYTYLALVNGVQHCSDEDYYARKAYQTYLDGGLEKYAVSAMTSMAVAKMHAEYYDSALFWIDTCIVSAKHIANDYILVEGQRIKANYLVLVDSLNAAQHLYSELERDYESSLRVSDYGNIAYIYASQGENVLASKYLSRAKENAKSSGMLFDYWVKASHVFRLLPNLESPDNYQDSLNNHRNQILNEALKHASNASQRDYADWRLQLSERRSLRIQYLLLFVFVCLLFSIITFMLYWRKKKLEIQLQSEKIEKLQLLIKQREQDIADGLQQIKASKTVAELQDAVTRPGLPHVEWDCLYSLFCDKLPLYEKALRELTPLSETEWRVCMLLKLGFPPTSIALLMSKSNEGIASIRRRLFEKVFHKKGKPSEWNQFIETL